MLKLSFDRIRKDIVSKAGSIIISATSFLLALGINSYVGEQKDLDTYRAILTSIRSEAESNKVILDKSYSRLSDPEFLILKEFSLNAASQALSNPLFVKHSGADRLVLLNQYVRDMAQTNSTRRAVEEIVLGSGNNIELEPVKQVWKGQADQAAEDVAKVIALK